MQADREEKIYGIVLKMVLWGESKEDALHKLRINGIEGAAAEEIYAQARGERLATIQGMCLRKAAMGFALAVAGFGIWAFFWYRLGGISRGLLFLTIGTGIFGLVKFVTSIFGIIFAATKKGSIADLD